MSMRPNYYILFKLSKDEKDLTKIKEKINKSKAIWQKKRIMGGLDASRAQENLSYIDHALQTFSTPSSCETERQAYLAILKQQTKDGEKKLKELLPLLGAEVSKKKIKEIASQAEVSEEVVIDFLKKAGRVIIEKDSTKHRKPKYTPPKGLDKAKYKVIVSLLKLIGEDNLFSFMGVKESTPIGHIHDKAIKEQKELKSSGKTDKISTAKGELYGIVTDLFSTTEKVDQYKNSIILEGFSFLESIMKISLENNMISAEKFNMLVDEGLKKGLSKADVIGYIEYYAESKKWILQVAIKDEKYESGLKCSNCNAFNTISSKSCFSCSASLIQDCPKCKATSTVDKYACPKCNFVIGEYETMIELLVEAKQLVDQSKFSKAEGKLDLLKRSWSDWEEIKKLQAEINSKQRAEDAELSKIRALIGESKLYTAKRLLQGSTLAGNSRVNSLLIQLTNSINKAESLYKQYTTLKLTDQENALNALNQIKLICADYPNIDQLLSSIAPKGAQRLKISQTDHGTFELSWKADLNSTEEICLLRKQKGASNSTQDGDLLYQGKSNSYTDNSPPKGVPVFYTLIVIRGNVESVDNISRGPVRVMETVQNLKYTSQDGQIAMRWTAPPEVIGTEIYYGESESAVVNKQSQMIETRSTDQVITKLKNNTNYVFSISYLYKDLKRPDIRVAGPNKTFNARPVKPDDPIKIIESKIIDSKIQISWEKANSHPTKLYISTKPHNLIAGDVIDSEQSHMLGELALHQGEFEVLIPSDQLIGTYYITPASVMYHMLIVGKMKRIVHIPQVTGLEAEPQEEMVTLRWKWPKNVSKCAINFSSHGIPNKDDSTLVSKSKYQERDCFNLKINPKVPGQIAVWSLVGDEYSDPVSLKYSGNVQSTVYFEYQKGSAGFLGIFKSDTKIKFNSEETIVINKASVVASEKFLPLEMIDGVLVGEIEDMILKPESNQELVLSQKYNFTNQTKLMIFSKDKAQSKTLTFIRKK